MTKVCLYTLYHVPLPNYCLTLVPIWDARSLVNSIDHSSKPTGSFAGFSIEKVEKYCPEYAGELAAGDIVGLYWTPSVFVSQTKPKSYSFNLMAVISFARRATR